VKTMTASEFKRRFTEAMEAVMRGETIILCYGRKRRKVAAIVPYCAPKALQKRPLGLLRSRVRAKFGRDFVLTDDEFLTG
jgi:antitoxin (DNA-binding transcriptional repressor) of toxin-antitoxin stability system